MVTQNAKIGKTTPNMEAIERLVHYAKNNPGNPKVKNALSQLAKSDPVNVMTSIIRQSFSLYKKETEHFLNARMAAKNVTNPNRELLVEFYTDLVLDAFIFGMSEKRILKISNKRVKVNNAAGEKDEEKTKLLQKKWFNDFVKKSMEAKFWGHSLVYFYEFENREIKSTKLVYRQHVLPERNLILKHPSDVAGIDYTQPPYSNYCISIGEDEDLGIYEKIALMYILKKHSWGNWDEFEEIYGIPIRIAKTASQDNKVRAEISNWLSSMGTAAYGVFPSDTELDIKENNKSDAFQVFYEKIQACNFEIEIALTGQNRITQKGGSYAKEKEMSNETDELTEDDKTFMYHNFNDKLKRVLINLGYPLLDTDTIEWDDAKEVTITERLNQFKTVNDMGFELDAKQVEKETNIIIVGKKQTTLPPVKKAKKPTAKNAFENFIKMHTEINNLYKK